MATNTMKFRKKNNASSFDQTKRPQYSGKEMEHITSKEGFKKQFIKWNTFMKENYDIFATWYLQLNLFLYQKILLHLMGKTTLGVIIASRGISKSFLIAIYACCKAILEPGSIIVISSATRGQSMLILKEKIQNELCKWSPPLAREIKNIKVSQNDGLIEFHNTSRIVVATASENAEFLATCLVINNVKIVVLSWKTKYKFDCLNYNKNMIKYSIMG